MKRCVVNFASPGWWIDGQKRLGESLKAIGFNGDFVPLQEQDLPECPSVDRSTNYACKAYSMKRAKDMGYGSAIYLDCSIVARDSLIPLFNRVEKEGYMLLHGGGCLGMWSSDACLEHFGISRDEAMTIVELGTCCLGLWFEHPTARTILSDMMYHIADFKGERTNEGFSVSKDFRVLGHRHDQTVLSLIVYSRRLKMTHPAYAPMITRYGKPLFIHPDCPELHLLNPVASA